jgi:replicative DNA helicase
MHVERVLERILAIEGRTRIDDLRRGTLDEATRAGVGAAAIRLRDELPIVERVPAGGVPAIADEVSALRAMELVVIDGLDALLPGTRNTEEEEAAAIRALKQLALDTRAAVLVTAPIPHLSIRDDRRPGLDDFSARGAIKERADVVLALFREGMYDSAHGIEGATELLVRKNRNGGVGYVDAIRGHARPRPLGDVLRCDYAHRSACSCWPSPSVLVRPLVPAPRSRGSNRSSMHRRARSR